MAVFYFSLWEPFTSFRLYGCHTLGSTTNDTYARIEIDTQKNEKHRNLQSNLFWHISHLICSVVIDTSIPTVRSCVCFVCSNIRRLLLYNICVYQIGCKRLNKPNEIIKIQKMLNLHKELLIGIFMWLSIFSHKSTHSQTHQMLNHSFEQKTHSERDE